ncbi:SAF domain-containing protein [Pseudonocardia lacus]|uniref:SAF domain-containing protein n=1 Tax=Pseudonocardia lacus TaxID=2835865 RepID=UPI001BDCAE31|nr:SAF domain-containing protein [Pseudonocardia lacus]
MTSTVLPAQPASGHAPRIPPVRRRGSTRLLLLGVVLAVLGALSGVVLLQVSSQREPVVVMATTVPFGQTVAREHLREVALAADSGLTTVPWTEVDSVVGRIATTDLLAGQAVTPDAVTTTRLPTAGNAVVGVSVQPGRLPVTPLQVRDEVLVVAIDDPGVPQRATVLRVGEPDAAGRRTVDLLVDEGVGVELARISAEDRAVLVHVAGR